MANNTTIPEQANIEAMKNYIEILEKQNAELLKMLESVMEENNAMISALDDILNNNRK